MIPNPMWVSIRQHLLRDLVALVLASSLAMIVVTVLGTRQMVSTLSRAAIEQSLDATQSELAAFFEPVVRALQSAVAWGDAGLLDRQGAAGLNRLFRPLMTQYPRIATLVVATGEGREYMLTRHPDRWTNREIRPGEWTRAARWLQWLPGRAEAAVTWTASDYDPRERPWYRAAIERRHAVANVGSRIAVRDLIAWSRPYLATGTGRPSITASIAFGPTPGAERVIAFDVDLDDVLRTVSGLHLGRGTEVLVMTEARTLLAATRGASLGPGDDAVPLEPVTAPGWRDLAAAVDPPGPELDPRSKPVRLEVAGTAHWVGAREMRITGERNLHVVAAVSERLLLGELPRLAWWLGAIAIAVLALAIARAHRMAREFSEPIEALVDESDRISRGVLDVASHVRSPVLELRRLGAAHERMRQTLRLLVRLEGDLQLARRIQENTLPRALPDVRGFDIAAWSEPAAETGGDTYDIVEYRTGAVTGLPGMRPSRALLLLADATGHGIGPALSAAQIRAMLRMAVRTGTGLEELARHINDQLCEDLFGGRFITAWIAIAGSDGSLTTFSAGQAPMLHFRASENRFAIIEADAPPFGITPGLEIDIAPPLKLQAGDIYVALSDGVFDTRDAGGERYGVQRVQALVERHRHDDADAIVEALRQDLAAFAGNVEAVDDRTGIVLRRRSR